MILYKPKGWRAMELTLSMFLIVCPFAFLAGFVDSIGGGGGLISIPAYLLAGLPAHETIYTNRLSACLGTITATIRYCKNHYIDYGLAVVGIATAALGGLSGANLALWVNETIFKILLIILLPLVAMYVLLKKDLEPKKDTPAISKRKQYFIVSTASFFIAMYAGFYGPCSGTFLILVYSACAKMDILKAEGNAKLINMVADICSLSVFLWHGVVLIPLGLAAAVFSIAGNYIGAGVVMKNGYKVIRVVIFSVLLLLFLKIAVEGAIYLFRMF